MSPARGSQAPPGPTGLLIVDKPGGVTSHDVVARARRALGTRKVGHAGTLDPMATGVLVLGVGRATRLLGHLMLTEKAYEATARLGVATTTDDAEGEVLRAPGAAGLDPQRAREALDAFRGEIDQVPTAVSAIKVDGKRAYARVRDGEEVELKARRVVVHRLEAGEARAGDADGVPVLDLDLAVRCSSGTYIRALARDLGRALGTEGHLTALRRSAVGPYGLDRAVALDDLAEAGTSGGAAALLLSIEEAAGAVFARVDLDDDEAARVRVGGRIARRLDAVSALYAPDGAFLALYEPQDDEVARAVAVFV